ncbi:MAG: virulence factor SrfC family protein [Planctomycetaceae bacterium]
MAFPDDRDRELLRSASQVFVAAEDLLDWMSQHKDARQTQDLCPISGTDEFQLMSLLRTSGHLVRSSKVPVAAAVYGASQVGKSLFVGRVLHPADERFSPLGRDEVLGPPAYFADLSFDQDLNPQCGSNEATAIVTRFTTKDRFDESVPTKYPVLVRGLTRAEWLRVLARGFRSECDLPPDDLWQESQLEKLFEEHSGSHRADTVDREWRMDLLDVYSYLKRLEPLRYRANETLLNGLISRYPLTKEGYVSVAARLSWNSWPSLTSLFNQVWKFLEMTRQHGHEGIVCHWAAVRFLLDSQRTTQHENRNSKVFPKVSWNDLVDRVEDGWYVLDYSPGQGPPKQELATIQSAMLELVVPVLPDRLNEEWRHVLELIDFLDIPGMRAQGRGAEEGLLKAADSLDDKMNIVKRGKVFYLFERYIEEMQIQTLLLLVRYGNLDVRGLLKEYVDKWGRIRYGKDNWPHRVHEDPPAFFVGMTGIDDEFRTRDAKSELYNARIRTIAADTFKEVMSHFGGRDKLFTNLYPIRYPGTWDDDAASRQKLDPQKWVLAGKAFLEADLVQKHVAAAPRKWEAAMRDGDGGASLIAAAFRHCTSALRKQDELSKAIAENQVHLAALARNWAVDPNANLDRDRRINSAQAVLTWCTADEQMVYTRIQALQESLCFQPGDVVYLSDLADINVGTRQRPEPLEKRLLRELPPFLMEWGKNLAPARWQEFTAARADADEWLKPETFGTFARYLAEYLCSEAVLNLLAERLLKIISLQHRDELARKNARRKFTRMTLNDFVINPGPDLSPLNEIADPKPDRDFGLMAPLITRWQSRLPEAFALAAGADVKIPPGNSELHDWLTDFQAAFP